jgi:O-antigen ligase
MRQLLLRLRPTDAAQWVFVGFLGLLLGGGALAGLLRQPALLVPALGIVGVALVLAEWRWLYYGLFLTLPFSLEIPLPGGFMMDVPSEPFMLGLTASVPLVLLLGRGGLGQLRPREWRHPLLLLPLLLIAWATLDTVFSVDKLKSFKYVLAKLWYFVPFVLGTLLLVRRPVDFWRVAACYVGAATAELLLWILPRHAVHAFSFGSVNGAAQPFFPNHVIYATMLALLLPLALGLAAQATSRAPRYVWRVAAAVLLFGLITSYTRASWLALPVAGIYYLVLRWRLTRLLLAGFAVAVAGTAIFFVQEDNFMRFAPDYEKTIWHGGNFEAHMASTYKLQDVSGMERVYRWVAAARMVADKPATGSGPSTFYPEYKRYTITGFRTYVSDNPEHSTTHNYFLLLLAEQGVPGFLLFCVLLATALLTIERLYFLSRARPEVHRIVLAGALSLVIIIFHLFLNELVEVDKIGSMFLVILAMLVRCGTWLEEGEKALVEPPATPTSPAGSAG